MKLITATLARPVSVKLGLRKPFFEQNQDTYIYFNWLRDNFIDHSLTFHEQYDDGVESAYLIAIVDEDDLEHHDYLWETMVEANMSYWFKTETFCTVGKQDVVGQAKSAS